MGDDDTYTAKAVRYKRLNDEYDSFAKAAGLRSQKERENIAEFGAKDSKDARKAARSTDVTKVKNSDLENGLPIRSKANSIVDKTDDAGKTLQRRLYGVDGKAIIDYDTSDHGLPKQHPTGAHKHIFDYTKKSPRGAPEELTEEELEQNSDIVQRGGNYHDKE